MLHAPLEYPFNMAAPGSNPFQDNSGRDLHQIGHWHLNACTSLQICNIGFQWNLKGMSLNPQNPQAAVRPIIEPCVNIDSRPRSLAPNK